MSNGGKDLLKNIALSAYGWSHLHSLNWGSGGSERWMEARPYVTPTGCQDQRGFHIFDWYLEIAADFLPNDPHCFLLQAGQPGDPSRSQPVDFDTLQYDEYCIAHLLFDETIHDPTAPHRLLDPIPSEVQAGFFWLLSADSDTSESAFSWFKPDGQPNPSARMLRRRISSRSPRNQRSATGTAPLSPGTSAASMRPSSSPLSDGGTSTRTSRSSVAR